MTFDEWLRAQAGRDDPVGDLARDYRADCRRQGVESMTVAELRSSIRASGAGWGAVAHTLTVALREWSK